jgi:hypothetical protein
VIRRTKLTMTAKKRIMARNVGPKRSSKPACPFIRIDLARQWYVNSAYPMVNMATPVNRNAEMKATRSPKLSIPMARAPRITVKLSHDKNVRSLAKKTLGSTRVGSAMRLPKEEVKTHKYMILWATYRGWSGEEAEKTW